MEPRCGVWLYIDLRCKKGTGMINNLKKMKQVEQADAGRRTHTHSHAQREGAVCCVACGLFGDMQHACPWFLFRPSHATRTYQKKGAKTKPSIQPPTLLGNQPSPPLSPPPQYISEKIKIKNKKRERAGLFVHSLVQNRPDTGLAALLSHMITVNIIVIRPYK